MFHALALDRVGRPVGTAAGRGHREAEAEGPRRDPVHLDADQPGRGLVLHDGAHAAAELGPVQQQVDRRDQDEREDEPVDVDVREVEAKEVNARVRPVDGRLVDLDLVGPVDLVEDALDDQRYRIGDEQGHGRALGTAQRPDEGPVDHGGDAEHRRDGDEQPDENVDVEVAVDRVAKVGAQDDQDTLGDVDDVEHAEDQRQADGYEGVHAPHENPVDDGLVKLPRHKANAPSWSVLCLPGDIQLVKAGLVARMATDPGAAAGRAWP